MLDSVGSMSTNVCAKFRFAALSIKKALGIFRELKQQQEEQQQLDWIFWNPPSGSKNIFMLIYIAVCTF